MRPRGVTLTETLVACLLLSTLMSLLSATVVRLDRQRRTTEQARIALDELSNQLDRLTMLSREELPAAMESLKIISSAAQRLPAAELTAYRMPGPSGSRLAVSITWCTHGMVRTRPLTLVAWLADRPARNTP